MDNKEKSKKPLIIVLSILVLIAFIVWGIVLSIILSSKTSKSDDNNKNGIISETTLKTDTNEDVEVDTKSLEEKHQKNTKTNEKTKELKNKLMGNIVTEHDDMNNLTWYSPKGELNYLSENGDETFMLYVYLGEQDSKFWPRLRVGFQADDWIFANKIIVKANEDRFTIPFDYFQDRNGEVLFGNGIVEWIDLIIDDVTIDNLEKVINSSSSKVRFSGDTYYKDYTVNSTQKEQLKTIIEYYKLVK